MPKGKITGFDVVREIGLALPEVAESTVRGQPALRLSGRLLACPALHSSAEPNSIVVNIEPDERAALLKAQPKVYYLTEHYKGYSAVLVRLPQIQRGQLEKVLISAWRFVRSRARKVRPRRDGRE